MGLTGLVILALILASFSRDVSGVNWNALKVKYTPLFNGLFNIPLTTKEIGKEYLFLKAHEEFPKVSIYCLPNDPRVCFFYDDHGNIAGLRVAFIIKDIKQGPLKEKKFPYTFDDKPIYKKGSAYNEDFYYIDVLFIRPDSLKDGGPRKRVEKVGNGLFLKMDGENWAEIPRKEKELEKTLFKRQNCFLGMGRHYFYNLTESSACNDIQPPFLLFDDGEVVGMGLVTFGKFNSVTREWYEHPPNMITKMILPHRPPCVTEWATDYGITAIHIYFIKSTRLLCVF